MTSVFLRSRLWSVFRRDLMTNACKAADSTQLNNLITSCVRSPSKDGRRGVASLYPSRQWSLGMLIISLAAEIADHQVHGSSIEGFKNFICRVFPWFSSRSLPYMAWVVILHASKWNYCSLYPIIAFPLTTTPEIQKLRISRSPHALPYCTCRLTPSIHTAIMHQLELGRFNTSLYFRISCPSLPADWLNRGSQGGNCCLSLTPDVL